MELYKQYAAPLCFNGCWTVQSFGHGFKFWPRCCGVQPLASCFHMCLFQQAV